MTTDATMLKNLRAAQRAAGQEFADRLADLVPAAEAVADLEGQLRAAEHQAGIYHDPRPPTCCTAGSAA
jgi:hypothetical protein